MHRYLIFIEVLLLAALAARYKSSALKIKELKKTRRKRQ
jgi:hypothetical protein